MTYPNHSFCKDNFLNGMVLVIVLLTATPLMAQTDDQALISQGTVDNQLDTTRTDTVQIAEAAPLDISQTRGLFINTPDGNMQLRLLGSVRYLIVYDGLINTDKNGFNTFEIPPDDTSKSLPNYFNGLNQSRIGFEITRKTNKGDVFVRLESDFVGVDGFRIRHAYGQYGNFLFGQTWSLFSHVNNQPATADFAGPTSNVTTRTPQIRYSFKQFANKINLAIAFEYLIPNLGTIDTTQTEIFQLVPNFTFRVSKTYSWGAVQLSGILPTLSARDSNDNLIVRRGWGGSASVVINSWKGGTWYLQGVAGSGISTYFNDLSGTGSDVAIGPNNEIRLPTAFGYNFTYEHHWNDVIYTNITYGLLDVQQYSFTLPDQYKLGRTARTNTFWDITDGAKVGAEAIWGMRRNKTDGFGDALRFNMLFYYDF
jgi:hypothetical protein